MFLRLAASAWLLCTLTLITFAVFLANAEQKPSKKSKSVFLTGCLQEGKLLDRFLLKGANGKPYSLRSTSVKLSEHVGKDVSITGRLSKDEKRAQFDFEGSEANEEYGKGKLVDPIDVDVISLKVLTSSCR